MSVIMFEILFSIIVGIKSSLNINHAYVWDIHIRDNGKYYIFSFRPNNKHFGDWLIQFRQAHPDKVHGKWSRWF